MTPIRTGYYIFQGTRRSGRTSVETVSAPVQVVEVVRYNKPTELGVKMVGRQRAFRLESFEGTFTRLELSAEQMVDK